MKEVIINKCDFCKKVSFYKSSIKKHEKNCFFNPATRSCATCLWFSPLHAEYPVECYVGEIKEAPEGSRIKLSTLCEKWMDAEIYVNSETRENQTEMRGKLYSGQKDYFKALQVVNEKDAMRKSFSNEVLNAPDPIIKLFKNFVSEPKFE